MCASVVFLAIFFSLQNLYIIKKSMQNFKALGSRIFEYFYDKKNIIGPFFSRIFCILIPSTDCHICIAVQKTPKVDNMGVFGNSNTNIAIW